MPAGIRRYDPAAVNRLDHGVSYCPGANLLRLLPFAFYLQFQKVLTFKTEIQYQRAWVPQQTRDFCPVSSLSERPSDKNQNEHDREKERTPHVFTDST